MVARREMMAWAVMLTMPYAAQTSPAAKSTVPTVHALTIAEMEGIPLEAEQALNDAQKKAMAAVDWGETVETLNPYTPQPSTYPTAFPTTAPVPTTSPTPGPPSHSPTARPSSAIFRVKAASATEAAVGAAQTGLIAPDEVVEAKLASAKIDRQAAVAIAIGMVLTAGIISMTVIYLFRLRSSSTRIVTSKNQEVPLKPQTKAAKFGMFKHLVPRYMRPKTWQKDDSKQHMIHLGAMTQAPTVACL
jgi:hypothetical protein